MAIPVDALAVLDTTDKVDERRWLDWWLTRTPEWCPIEFPIDIVQILTVTVTVALQVTAVLGGWPIYLALPILWLIIRTNLVEHNLSHRPIFRPMWMNHVFGWLCFLSNGTPYEIYIVCHAENHHEYEGDEGDWTSLIHGFGTASPTDGKPAARWHYVLTFPYIAITRSIEKMLRDIGTNFMWLRFASSLAVIWAVCDYMVSVDLLRTWLFFFLPWLLVYFGLGDNNYKHHVGCPATTKYDHSNNRFLGPVRSALEFFVGLHTVHHNSPDLPWFLLPFVHSRVEHKILRKYFVDGVKMTDT